MFAAGALPAWSAPPKEARAVKITGLEVFRVHVNRRGDWVLFRMQTDAGLTGIGDASHGGRDDRVIELARGFFASVQSGGIFDVEPLRRTAHPEVARSGRPAAVALGGLEQCLWDLQGKALGVPLYKLFGGMLQREIRNYANINRSTEDRTPAGFAATAGRAIEAGFDAIKLAPFDGMPRPDAEPARIEAGIRLGVDCVKAVRQTVGPKNDVLVDVHSTVDLERGRGLVRSLEPVNLFWLEEVTRNHEHLAILNREAPMPTAGGESLFGVRAFYRYIAAGAVDIVMPDIKYCGGLMEMKKIAAMAEGAGLLVSPHGPASPVGNMAAAHVCATLPNFSILEFSFGETQWRAELVEPPEQIPGGRIRVPDRPGIGCELNEKTIRKYAP
jgi:galactonate dehydratase